MAKTLKVPAVQVRPGNTVEMPTYAFTEGGVAIDLVADGWGSWRAHWRTDPGAADFIPFDVDASDAANGRISLSMAASDSDTIDGPGVWDLESRRTTADGLEIHTWIEGITTVTRKVTRDV